MGRTPPTARTYPKRKRVEIVYTDPDPDDVMEDDWDDFEQCEDEEFSDFSAVEAPPKKRIKANNTEAKIVSTKPLPKPKIFPFDRLPAELKNQIYEIVLTDKNGINLISKTKHYRRTVRRDVASFVNSSSYTYRARNRWQYPLPQPPASDVQLKALVPNIILLNRQIFRETQPILYGSNAFFVEDTTVLHNFLAIIGRQNRGTLTNLTIKGWGISRGHKVMNHPAFTMLADAVNLQRLHMDCRIHWGGGPQTVARQFYRECFHYLEGIGSAKGSFDAAVELIDVLPSNFDIYRYGQDKKPSNEDNLEKFQNELRKLLSSR